MARWLLSPVPRERWQQAFPEGCRAVALEAVDGADVTSVWLDLPAAGDDDGIDLVRTALEQGAPVVCMTGVPDQGQGLRLLQAGAQGYCHIGAAPEQLREIALVVEHSGLWMPPELMQGFLAKSVAMAPGAATATVELNALTPRELAVAEQVALGASNREISDALSISERTVKAHLTAIFEKLGLRDRVQLALAMNNIPT
jgi:DNA-binding NarL/FixJ family response regulator